jgi:4-hydroxy-tetrahydrodipicolinate synthase
MALDLTGAVLPIITPFTADDELDLPGLHTLVDWWITEGVGGLIVAGSAGEFLQLTEDEYDAAVSATVQATAGRVPVLAGVTHDSTRHAIRRAKAARAAGVDGVMLAPPFYTKVQEAALEDHFRVIAAAADRPVMIYNNPFTTGVDLSPSFLAHLAKTEPRFEAVKDTTWNVQRVIEIQQLSEGRMAVHAGLLGYESILLGAAGWVSIPGLVAPRLASELCEAAAAGDRTRAAECHRRIFPLMKIEEDTDKYVEIPKAALALMGRAGGAPRPPRQPLQGAELERLTGILEQLELIGEREVVTPAR